jgi:hypothetical protein
MKPAKTASAALPPRLLSAIKARNPSFSPNAATTRDIEILVRERDGLLEEASGYLEQIEVELDVFDESDATAALISESKETIVLASRCLGDALLVGGYLDEAQRRQRMPVDRQSVMLQSNALIIAIEDALSYDPGRHHNQYPLLRIEDERYLTDLRKILTELKRLNQFLEQMQTPSAATSSLSRQLAKNFQKFADNYIPLLAKGTAALTIASMAALLAHLGVGSEELDKVASALRMLR